MFGVHIPSISDIKNTVTGAASTALHTTEDLGASAVSHAASLGRSGLDLGRSAVTAISHVDVQKVGSTVIGAIGKGESYAEHGIQTGVMKAGQGVHAAADFGRSHITGSDPLSRLARGAITVTEDTTRFDIGVVGGVGKAAVGLVGSVGQLGVLATEYQVSPTARAAIDAKVAGAVTGGAKSVAGYADSVAHDPSRVFGDAAHVAGAAGGWVKGEVNSAEQAIKDGHGPESFGMQVGNAATYLIPVGGEVRAAAGVGELATRGLVSVATEDGARALTETGARAVTQEASRTVGSATAGAAARTTEAATRPAAEAAGGIASGKGVYFFDKQALPYIDRADATLSRAGSSHFFMPLEDSAVVKDAASAYRYTGGAPSLERAYTGGGDVFGVQFPLRDLTPRLPTAADANGFEHFLEGGHTALRLSENGGYLVNPTREFVVPGGAAMPQGSVLFRIGEDGARLPMRTW